jgi:NTP pyrophosphatase (non-canonical NTP hydrolase)
MAATFPILELEVIRWAEARKIIPNSNLSAQARKSLEEAGELLEAAASLVSFDPFRQELSHNSWKDKYEDAVGDVLVTLIIGCALADINITDCLEKAYNEIKDRKGTLRADGIFVKESSQ